MLIQVQQHHVALCQQRRIVGIQRDAAQATLQPVARSAAMRPASCSPAARYGAVQQEHRVRRQQRQVAAKGHGIEREGHQG
jgi:hypothetical protein